jgi:hypothetical protein
LRKKKDRLAAVCSEMGWAGSIRRLQDQQSHSLLGDGATKHQNPPTLISNCSNTTLLDFVRQFAPLPAGLAQVFVFAQFALSTIAGIIAAEIGA